MEIRTSRTIYFGIPKLEVYTEKCSILVMPHAYRGSIFNGQSQKHIKNIYWGKNPLEINSKKLEHDLKYIIKQSEKLINMGYKNQQICNFVKKSLTIVFKTYSSNKKR